MKFSVRLIQWVVSIVWDKGNPKVDARGIAYQHEFILVYEKRVCGVTSNQEYNKNGN